MSRAQRRREQRAARQQDESLASRQALRERQERKRARNLPPELPGDRRPLLVRIVREIWAAFVAHEKRDFWRFAGVMSLIGRGMGIDTRDPRLPGWTGLNKPDGAPRAAGKPEQERRP